MVDGSPPEWQSPNWATTSFETLPDKTVYLLYTAANQRGNTGAVGQLMDTMKRRMNINSRIPQMSLVDAFRRRVFASPINIPQEPDVVRRESLGQSVTDIEELYKNFFENRDDLFTL